MGSLDPQKEAKPGGRRPGVLYDNLQVRRGQRVKAFRRGGKLGLVIDKGKPTPVEGQEQRVIEGHRKRRHRCQPMRREKPGCRSGSAQAGVKTKDNIGIGRRPFKLDAGQQGRPIARRDEFQIAGAGRLERLFNGGARAPVRGEAVIGQHDKNGCFRQRRKRDGGKARSKEFGIHKSLHDATDWSGMEKPMHLPSAGMIRFRFDGFTSLHLSP